VIHEGSRQSKGTSRQGGGLRGLHADRTAKQDHTMQRELKNTRGRQRSKKDVKDDEDDNNDGKEEVKGKEEVEVENTPVVDDVSDVKQVGKYSLLINDEGDDDEEEGKAAVSEVEASDETGKQGKEQKDNGNEKENLLNFHEFVAETVEESKTAVSDEEEEPVSVEVVEADIPQKQSLEQSYEPQQVEETVEVESVPVAEEEDLVVEVVVNIPQKQNLVQNYEQRVEEDEAVQEEKEIVLEMYEKQAAKETNEADTEENNEEENEADEGKDNKNNQKNNEKGDDKDKDKGKEEEEETKLLEACEICESDFDCKSNICMIMEDNNICAEEDGLIIDSCACVEDGDCSSGACSINNFCLVTTGNLCYLNGECASGVCKIEDVNEVASPGKCVLPLIMGDECNLDEECPPGGACDNICKEKSTDVGSKCESNDDCDTGRCDAFVCAVKVGSCDACNEDFDCASNACRLYAGSSSVCADDSFGLMADGCFCKSDAHCLTGRCEGTTCAPKLHTGDRCEDGDDCISGDCSLNFLFIKGTCRD